MTFFRFIISSLSALFLFAGGSNGVSVFGGGVREVQALKGARGLLQCPVFAYGSGLKVTWLKQGVDVATLDSRLSVNQRSGALRVNRAQFQDSGRYMCTVDEPNSTVRSNDTILQVVSYPRITLTQNATVARNTTGSLLCKVESVPVSYIVWKRHYISIPHWDAATIKEGGIPGALVQTSQSEGIPSVTVSQLYFPSVQPFHAGLYVCLGSNTPGTARATLSLRVTYAPVTNVKHRRLVGWPGKIPALSIKFKADPPPRIVCDFQSSDSDKLLTDNGNQPNNEFDNNSSYNVAKGNSSNAIEILEDRHWTVEMFHGPELTNVTIQLFPELSKSIFGTYSCLASNSAGEDTAFITLLRGRAPQPPEVTIESKKPSWLVLRVRLPSDMGRPLADTICARYLDVSVENGEPVDFDKVVTATRKNVSQHWNLTGLIPGHQYSVRLRLSSPYTTSNYSTLRVTLPMKDVPDAVQFSSSRQGKYPRAYVLSWNRPTTHGSQIYGYTLTYTPVRVVDGINGPIVVESLGTKQLVKLHNSAIKIVISGLAESTYYRATLVVHSGVGDSKASAFLFVTASDRSSRKKHGKSKTSSSSTSTHSTDHSQLLILKERVLEENNANSYSSASSRKSFVRHSRNAEHVHFFIFLILINQLKKLVFTVI